MNSILPRVTRGRRAGRKSTIWLPAKSLTSRTSNGASAGLIETTTHKVMVPTLDFDQTADEFAQFTVAFPKSWDKGTITFQPVWTASAGTPDETVAWALQAVALADGDAMDTAFGTPVVVSDVLLGTGDNHWCAESGAVTVAGAAANPGLTVFQLFRDVSADNLAADARLIGVKVFFNENTHTDA